MSYPRKRDILIVEDEQQPIDAYRDLLGLYREELPCTEPLVARNYADAEAFLKEPRIIHCMILDLNLPLERHGTAGDGLTPGEQLLQLAANRDEYPIPVMMVISGKLETAGLKELQDQLEEGFWHGELINKKDPRLPEKIKNSLQKSQEYIDVGIHMRDGGSSWFPTLSPREEDLLRRCILKQSGCLGVDLEWWTAETGPSVSRPTSNDGPTKVLMGRFLLDDSLGFSLPTFFKFEPKGNAEVICRDVKILGHKLAHVKPVHTGASPARCLLVTQSVTNGRPVSFDHYLCRDDAADDVIPHLVADIVEQLEKLSGVEEDQVPVSSLLWQHYKPGILEETSRLADHTLLGTATHEDPIRVQRELEASSARIWVTKRSCTHGDLNASNVAVDLAPADRPHAFIFDASGIHADVDSRDLAYLEVTTLLYAEAVEIPGHFTAFDVFYGNAIDPGPLPNAAVLPPQVRRTRAVIAAIRKHVASFKNAEMYPLVLFNAAMMQLSGLITHPTPNKVVKPELAYILAVWSATWVKKMMPALFVAPTSSTTK